MLLNKVTGIDVSELIYVQKVVVKQELLSMKSHWQKMGDHPYRSKTVRLFDYETTI